MKPLAFNLSLAFITLLFLWLLIPVAKAPACAHHPAVKINLPAAAIDASYASTPAQIRQGLAHCAHLPPAEGMYFALPSSQVAVFWMKDMLIPIDIVWLRGEEVIGIEANVAPAAAGTPDKLLPLFRSPGLITAVLELPAGKAAEYGLEPGRIISPPSPLP
jgi:uncharacterized protein